MNKQIELQNSKSHTELDMPATHTANGGDNGEWGRSRQPRQSEGFNDYNFQEFRDDKHVKHNCAIEKKRSHTQYILYCIAYSLLHMFFFLRKKTSGNFQKGLIRKLTFQNDVDIERFGFVELMGELMLKTDDYKNI